MSQANEVQHGGELWKPVPEHEGYEVSNCGRVRSYKKYRNGAPIPKTPRIVPPRHDKDGYERVTFYTPGNRKEFRVHVLVLLVFGSQKPAPPHDKGLHKNGNNTDNRIENLYWGSTKQNSEDSKRHGTYVHGTRVSTCVLNPKQVKYIYAKKGAKGVTARQLAERFGCTIFNIYAIWGRKTWRHILG